MQLSLGMQCQGDQGPQLLLDLNDIFLWFELKISKLHQPACTHEGEQCLSFRKPSNRAQANEREM